MAGNIIGMTLIDQFKVERLVALGGMGAVCKFLAGAGTPAYMAPEQIHLGTITPATDIYALRDESMFHRI